VSCRQVQEDVAGALLTHGDLDQVASEHAALCPACAAEQASLRQVASVMALLTAKDMGAFAPLPADDLLLQRILRSAATARAQERRHTRLIRGLAVAVAAVIAVVGIGVGVAILAPDTHAITASATARGLEATADIAPQGSGSEVRISITGLPHDTDCLVVVHSADGAAQQIVEWTVEYEGTGRAVGSATAAPEAITNVTLTKPDGTVLLDIPVTA
jgi:hypothetical protein